MRSNWRLVLLLLLLGLNWLQPVHAQTKGSAKTIKIALAAPIGPTTLQSGYGPLTYGSEFGFSITADDMTVFASHAVAAQSVIAGQNNVVSGSFISLLLLRQAGQDFKMFCPVVSKIDHVIVGRNGIKTLAQVVDPQTRVGVDSPGGGGEAVLNALFVAHHLDVTVRDLKNVKRVDGLVPRYSAWLANQVDVTTFRLSQFRQAQKDMPDGVIIAKLYEDVPQFIFASFAAQGEWLSANRELAAGLCASSLKATVALTRSYDLYETAIKTVIPKPPAESEIKESFDLINQYGFWVPSNSMSDDAVKFMGQLAIQSGLLTEPPVPADVLDRQTFEAALQMLTPDERKALETVSITGTPSPVATTRP